MKLLCRIITKAGLVPAKLSAKIGGQGISTITMPNFLAFERRG
jgi:hypothetical protein